MYLAKNILDQCDALDGINDDNDFLLQKLVKMSFSQKPWLHPVILIENCFITQ